MQNEEDKVSPVDPAEVLASEPSSDDEQDSASSEIARTPTGRFPKGVSGNPAGRPKGSKNQVTLLKLMAEEAVRSQNLDRMLSVADKVIEQALSGDTDSQKLVWQAIMSKGSVDDRSQAKEKVSITINSLSQDSPKEVKGETYDHSDDTE